MENVTQETLALMEKSLAEARPDVLAKAGYTANATATQGLQGYDLSPVVHSLYTILTPLIKEIPRESGGFSAQANWKAVTAIDTTLIDPGVAEGKRNDVMSSTMSDYKAVYRGIGKEHKVTDEAYYAARNFDDLRSRANLEALQAALLDEEFMVLGGNTTTTGIALGTANTPSGTLLTSQGAMTAQATVCYVVGLTTYGARVSSVTGGVKTSYTRTNADATTDTIKPGHGIVSAESAAVTTAAANLGVKWIVVPKDGEVAWAWYTGLTGAANCSLAAITTVPQFVQLADAAGTQKANATNLNADESQNALHYDGILTQVMKSGSGGYYIKLGSAVGGAKLTSDGAGGVTEISDALQNRWDNFKLSTFDILCNARDRRSISNLMLGNGVANGNVRLSVASGPGQDNITANTVVSGYNNPVTGELLRVIVHPWITQGTILLKHRGALPYAAAGVPNVWQIRCRQDWYSIEWPRRTRAYEIAVYCDEVLQGYAPFANGVITGALSV